MGLDDPYAGLPRIYLGGQSSRFEAQENEPQRHRGHRGLHTEDSVGVVGAFRDSEGRRRRVVADRLFERAAIVAALFFSRRGAEPQRGLACRRRSP